MLDLIKISVVYYIKSCFLFFVRSTAVTAGKGGYRMMEFHYVVATEDDIVFIDEVYHENIAALHGVQRTFAFWKECLSDSNSVYYIVYAAEPVAWFRVDIDDGGFWLGMLQVKPKYQRSGVGKAILSAFEKLAREKGVQKIGIHTTGDNAAARALYTAAGYAVTEIGPCTTADGVERVGYTFEKEIGN